MAEGSDPPAAEDGGILPTAADPRVETPYVVSLRRELGIRGRVVDLTFLHGYLEPTLLLLVQGRMTWAGSLAARRNTCSVTLFIR